MKTRNIVLVAMALVAVLVAAALYYLSSNLDPLVKSAIESYGSRITGTRVEVASVSISPRSGEGTIRGLKVANPAGFSEGTALEMEQLTMAIDIASLGGEPVIIKQVLVSGPKVNLEADAEGNTNIEAIGKHAKSASGRQSAEPEADATPRDTPAKRMRIDQFTFQQGTVSADLAALGAERYEAKLPAIQLENLGGAAGGTPTEIAKEVTTALSHAVSKVAAKEGAGAFIDRHLEGAPAKAAKDLIKGIIDLKPE